MRFLPLRFGRCCALALVAFGTPALAAPASVTVAGSMQSEAGCSGDFDAGCATTHLAFDASDDVWQGTFTLPAGSYEYKAAIDDAWIVNYGLGGVLDGPNIPLVLAASTAVKFYYDDKTHWITDNRSSVIAIAAGSFQSELGCPGDWQPDCLRAWLQDPDGNGVYTFVTSGLPPGEYEAKVAIAESWDENYGAGGVFNGSNIPFTVPAAGVPMTFRYDSSTHLLTIFAPSAVPNAAVPVDTLGGEALAALAALLAALGVARRRAA